MPLLLSFFSGNVLFVSARLFPFCSIILFFCAAFLLVLKKRTAMVLVIVLGFFIATLRAPSVPEQAGPWNRNVEVKGKFSRGDRPAADPDVHPFIVEKAFDGATGQEMDELEDERIYVRMGEEVDPDETYDLLVRTGKDRSRLNPGSRGMASLYASVTEVRGHEEPAGHLRDFFDPYRQSLKSYIDARFSPETAAFISAVTIGDVHLGEDLKQAFNKTGLAHILSISGTHFGLFSVVIFGICMFVIKRLPYRLLQRLTLHVSPSQTAAVICIPLMMLYLGISGGSIPAVRSFIMITLFLAGLLLGRKGFWLHTVLLAACALAFWDPEVVLSLSFQLSFLAVLFIGFSVERGNADETTGNKENRFFAFVKNSLRLTLAATIGTAPLVAYSFHYLSVISPLANLIAAPLIGFVVIPLALISSLSYLLTGVYLFAPLVSAMTEVSLGAVRNMARIPHADVAVPSFPLILIIFFYAAFLTYLAPGKKKMLLILPFVPFVIYVLVAVFTPYRLSVTFLDVGQGDAAVVELPDGRTMAIDTGRSGRETADFLAFIGKRRIDVLALSHAHPDHTGGVEYLLGRFPVSAVWDNGGIDYSEGLVSAGMHRALVRGDLIENERFAIQVLHPYREFVTHDDDEYGQENNSSLVLRISGKRHSFLFAGDIEEEAEDDLSHLGKWLRSDVMKVPHHGARTSVHDSMLAAISPAAAVISAGRDNTFGHPSPEMLQALAGTKIFRTDRDGAVKITETDSGLKVKTYRDYAFARADTLTGEWNNIRRLFTCW
ncbi:MAG: DNA internalization-related competence protein ComEC/Rec2 [Nitrospirae bacterium]|nr:DNA internalization-related competence protein ComEC/Rec2 [Nitrospirota bacterium]